MTELFHFFWNPYSLALALTGFFCIVLQYLSPLPSGPKRAWKSLLKDQTFMWVNYLVVPWLFLSLLPDVSLPGFAWLHNMPFAIRLLIFLILIDFTDYWIHVLLHKLPFLWKIHKVHHSIPSFFWERNQFFHPLEILVYGLLEFGPKAFLFSAMHGNEWIWVASIRLLIGNFAHTSTHIRLGFLESIINNPFTHCWHHAQRFGGRCNYGVTFVFWDILFGSFQKPKDISWPQEDMGFEGSEKIHKHTHKAIFLQDE